MSADGAYLDGTRLWGDDLTGADLEAWFADERAGYAQLGPPGEYGYDALNRHHGFRHVPNHTIDHALAFGAGSGRELLPIAERIRHATIVDVRVVASALPVPTDRVMPAASGVLPLADHSFDLATCFGALHHVANVSRVLGELHRVLRPGGYALVREPIVSLGDWRRPRRGLTKRERGLPLAWLHGAFARAGFTIEREAVCWFPPLTRTAHALGMRAPFTSAAFARLDAIAARAFAWNLRYHAVTAVQKLRPTSAFFVLRA